MPGTSSPVNNNSAANIRPPSPTQEQVRLGAATTNHENVDATDKMSVRALRSNSSSRSSSPVLSEGLRTPISASSTSIPPVKPSISESMDGSYVVVNQAAENTKSDKVSETVDSSYVLVDKPAENTEAPKESTETKPQEKSTFGFASRITSFFNNLGHKVQTGVESAEKFLAAAKTTFIDIGKSIIESINKMIASLSPR